jgi:sulfatase modifying factor 1
VPTDFIILIISLMAANQCPEGMVKVPRHDACIDKYEWPNVKGQKPEVGLSAIPSAWDKGIVKNAKQLCESVGKRVCTMEEWIASCRGPRGSDYPFGSKLPDPLRTTADAAPCNYAQPFTDPIEKEIWKRNPEEFARLDKRDPSGTRGCVSASGAEDMMGNCEEWVSCPSYMNKNGWCLAGRYWSEPYKCNRMSAGHDPGWHYYDTCGRCCSSLDIVPSQ